MIIVRVVVAVAVAVAVTVTSQKRKFHEINTRRITSGLIAADIRVNGGKLLGLLLS